MANRRPIISICIPTYNRPDALKACIQSIVGNKYYCDDIEIVVSDNASESNDIDIVMEEFQSKYKGIIYNKNEKNIGGEANFIKVLSLGTGEFLKILNDYSSVTEEGLGYLLSIVKKHREDKAMLFFNNSDKFKELEIIECRDIDRVVYNTNWKMSWLGAYGYWKDEYDKLPEKDRAARQMFMQIDWFLRLFTPEKKCFVCNYYFFDRTAFKAKQGGYNFIQVHSDNFLGMFKDSLYPKGKLSIKTYTRMKKRLCHSLFKWYIQLVIKKKDGFCYETDNAIDAMRRNFSGHWWYYKDLLWIKVRYAVWKLTH
ncbi:glycosyltransferase family 2 protein [Xylanibacter muris]|uniref:Glycosyltransferase family 2 protein n=1 Tax=Xylanibacter muris TaxID=2736290 RepID=A0ABX2AM26_9BACT|nr:glycosyltransferase family 2 protein [Xylanibacter muris]NPD91001.1 glycosyltransferase family 2 protein [Xylanibacter muris]